MDLKTILEQENHSVSTRLFGYDFNITDDRNVYNAIRNKYKDLAVAASKKFAGMDEQFTDINDLLNSAPDAFIVAIEDAITELLQDIISVDIYTIDKDAVVDMAFKGVYFDSFSEAYGEISERVNSILEELGDAEYAREVRKETRPRWQSATIGGNAINAWSNQLDAAAMNAVEGLAMSVINAIGNAISRSIARDKLNKLFNSKDLRQDMIDSVYDSCFDLHLLLIKIVNEHSDVSIRGCVNKNDDEKAQAMFNNFMSIDLDEEKRETFIKDIFRLQPYRIEFYEALIRKFGDADKNIGTFAETFGLNIAEIKNEILADYVKENLGETEEDAQICIDKMKQYAAEIGLDSFLIVQAKEIINQRIEELDLLYRTVDGIVFETREEADLAKEELVKIQEVMQTIQPPTKESTITYETDLLEKRKTIDACQTSVKDKYLNKIDDLLADFDRKFRGEGFFSSGTTREEAGNRKALQYVKTLPVNNYEELDQARELLIAKLPEYGISLEQAVLAVNYLNNCEQSLNTVDRIIFPTREEAGFARKELSEIKALMQNVTPPNADSLLPYESQLQELRPKLEQFTTPIKQKYINKVDSYLAKFDSLFKNPGYNQFETRREAAIYRSFAFVSKLNPTDYEALDDAYEQLKSFVPLVGIEYEEAVTAKEFLHKCYLKINTVDGVVFQTKEEADFGRKEYGEITAIMNGVNPPAKDSLLSYEKSLFAVRDQLEQFKTDIKLKYIGTINEYLRKFDDLFRQTGMFTKAETRQEAAQAKALKLVKSIAPVTCGYDEVDKASSALNDFLPEIGIDLSQAFAATEYIRQQEDRLNTVDGVVLSSREEAALAKTELTEIQNIMSCIVPPTSDSLLDYEEKLLEHRAQIEKYQTKVKEKYLGIIQKYLTGFDEKFRKVSLIKTAATREEAARERALKFVKSKTYNTTTDVENARNELIALLPKLGITIEQAVEAETHLTNVKNKIEGVATGNSKINSLFNRFKK